MRHIQWVLRKILLLILSSFFVYVLVDQNSNIRAIKPKKEDAMTLNVTSRSFKNGERLPDIYTCTSTDISPHLTWSKGPDATQSYALICDDPDAPSTVWVHWVLFNLSAHLTELHENITKGSILSNNAYQGTNNFGHIGYNGACPPLGHGTHHYYFKIYALDCTLKLEPGATKEELEAAMDGHILAKGQITGIYSR